MSAVHYAKRTRLSARLRLGEKPWIIGCVATESRLRACARKAPADCDWLEVRLDLTGLCKGNGWNGARRRRRADARCC